MSTFAITFPSSSGYRYTEYRTDSAELAEKYIATMLKNFYIRRFKEDTTVFPAQQMQLELHDPTTGEVEILMRFILHPKS
jgi:hypothetical protein